MSRAALAHRYLDAGPQQAKSWLIEAHPRDGDAGELIERISATDHNDRPLSANRDDAAVWTIHDRQDEEFELFVDTLDTRFWRMHSWTRMDKIGPWLNQTVENSRELDWVWLSSGHLRVVGKAGPHRIKTGFDGRLVTSEHGADFTSHWTTRDDTLALEVLRWMEHEESPTSRVMSVDDVSFATELEDGSLMSEKVDRQARLQPRGGDWASHENQVARIQRLYRKFVEALEAMALRTTGSTDATGWRVTGTPIVLRFRRIESLDHALAELFGGREPFRLIGTPVERDGFWRVRAVDLHVGQPMDVDVGADWARCYLRVDHCGNSVARLAANLEHNLDARIRFVDPELQALFAAA